MMHKTILTTAAVGSCAYIRYFKESHTAQCFNRSSTPKLIGVQIFFRHGARTPLVHVKGLKEVKKKQQLSFAYARYFKIIFA